eukprot:2566778-Pyramimonas_sp.AAC.1
MSPWRRAKQICQQMACSEPLCGHGRDHPSPAQPTRPDRPKECHDAIGRFRVRQYGHAACPSACRECHAA